MSKGLYIVLEGLDGSGKTTQYTRIMKHLPDTFGVREPGGTPMAEAIRTTLKDKTIERSPVTNTFLFSAARADLIETVIHPHITQGEHVLSDRSWLSTVAYQQAEGMDIERIINLSKLATGDYFEPDLLLFIDTDPDICQQRLKARDDEGPDYFETKGLSYFTKVQQAYRTHVATMQNGFTINGNHNPDQVWQAIAKVFTQQNITLKEGAYETIS